MAKPKIQIILPKVSPGSPEEATISRVRDTIGPALVKTGLIHHIRPVLSGPGDPRPMKNLVSPKNGLSPKGDRAALFRGEAIELIYPDGEKEHFTPEFRRDEIFYGRVADGRFAVVEHICGILRLHIEEEEDRLAWVGKMTALKPWELADHADDAAEIRARHEAAEKAGTAVAR